MPLETAQPLDALARQTTEEFKRRFGAPPTVVAAAPGRVNLIGEHTDYNDGFVLPMAIERYTVVAAAPRAGGAGGALLHSLAFDEQAELPLSPGPLAEGMPGWAPYVRGVLEVYAGEGVTPPPFEGVIGSNVPLGGGLSSSAALEVSLALAIEALSGESFDPARRALLCQRAEHLAGMPCGIMDQFSSTLCEADRLMLLDCRDQTFDMRPLDDPSVSVLVTNSNFKHELTGGEYADRRAQCEGAAAALGLGSLREATTGRLAAAGLDDLLLRRARHVITEIERTVHAADAVAHRRWDEAGALMYASHDSLRDDFEVSCPELDALVEAAREVGPTGGVVGSRMTGGGFGGCTVSLVRTEHAEEGAAQIAEAYQQRTGVVATQFITRPARGAHRLV